MCDAGQYIFETGSTVWVGIVSSTVVWSVPSVFKSMTLNFKLTVNESSSNTLRKFANVLDEGDSTNRCWSLPVSIIELALATTYINTLRVTNTEQACH